MFSSLFIPPGAKALSDELNIAKPKITAWALSPFVIRTKRPFLGEWVVQNSYGSIGGAENSEGLLTCSFPPLGEGWDGGSLQRSSRPAVQPRFSGPAMASSSSFREASAGPHP